MALPRLMLLAMVLFLASSNFSMVESKKPGKNKNPKPKLPNPNDPLVAFKHFRVEVHNDLHMYLLDAHCYSKDDDLGLHVLYPDQQQNWSFNGNWLGTTNFHCRLEWENGYLEYDAFKNDANLLENYCNNSICIWSARQDGVYLNNQDGNLVFYDNWEMLREKIQN